MELLAGPDMRLPPQPGGKRQLHRPGGPRCPELTARWTPRPTELTELMVLLGGDLRAFGTPERLKTLPVGAAQDRRRRENPELDSPGYVITMCLRKEPRLF